MASKTVSHSEIPTDMHDAVWRRINTLMEFKSALRFRYKYARIRPHRVILSITTWRQTETSE